MQCEIGDTPRMIYDSQSSDLPKDAMTFRGLDDKASGCGLLAMTLLFEVPLRNVIRFRNS